MSSTGNDWETIRLGDECEIITKGTTPNHRGFDYQSSGITYVKIESIGEDGKIVPTKIAYIDETCHRSLKRSQIREGDLLFSIAGALGRRVIADKSLLPANTNQAVAIIRLRHNSKLDLHYLFHYVVGPQIRNHIERINVQSAQANVSLANVNEFVIEAPTSQQQRKIARILTTVDNLIEKTEALIAKYQAIKQGMMHDLFTRGVDEHGHLRPPYEEAPELYKQSELGWIPKEWRVATLADVAESAIDGPFGSNLKTEHYVSEAGVRVIRLQNIDTGHYDDSDRAFISDSHAELLSRHRVIPGDVMIAGMGEETHPVARACLYPADLPPAINKADCFRVRCKAEQMVNPFLMLSLNAHYLRPWIERFAQGVTRTRINVRNLKTLPLKAPPLAEQRAFSRRMFAVAAPVQKLETEMQKLYLHKTGLMQDLLTGKVRVKVDEAEEVAAHA
ncbi:MAG: restriction endonuclease subunit S [Pirellulaceae bacterium]|nr:restriction endonuclease subunit S [Pirellulaceae bacterium]